MMRKDASPVTIRSSAGCRYVSGLPADSVGEGGWGVVVSILWARLRHVKLLDCRNKQGMVFCDKKKGKKSQHDFKFGYNYYVAN